VSVEIGEPRAISMKTSPRRNENPSRLALQRCLGRRRPVGAPGTRPPGRSAPAAMNSEKDAQVPAGQRLVQAEDDGMHAAHRPATAPSVTVMWRCSPTAPRAGLPGAVGWNQSGMPPSVMLAVVGLAGLIDVD